MRWLILFSLAACLPAHAQTAGAPNPGAPNPGAERKAAVDHMLDALKSAPTEDAAAPLEAQITELWMQSGSPAVTLLMARGLRELKAEAPGDAVEDLGAAIILEPGFAEAYHQRAIARFAAGDTPGAIADLQETLQLEPRDFGAFRTLAAIAESREDWKSAYAAWQRLMDIDPKTPGGEDKLKDLRRRALGDET
jgi:tetratricopeptide (TPR) repeat protein